MSVLVILSLFFVTTLFKGVSMPKKDLPSTGFYKSLREVWMKNLPILHMNMDSGHHDGCLSRFCDGESRFECLPDSPGQPFRVKGQNFNLKIYGNVNSYSSGFCSLEVKMRAEKKNFVGIQIYDGVNQTISERHPGDGNFHTLFISHKISAQAKHLDIRFIQADRYPSLELVEVSHIAVYDGEFCLLEKIYEECVPLESDIERLTAEATEKERLRAVEAADKTRAIQEKQELERRLAALVDPRGYREKMMALSQENLKFRRQRDGSWQVIQELRMQLDQEKSDLETQISVLTAQVKTLQDQLRGQTQDLLTTLGLPPAEGQGSEEGISLHTALKTLMDQKQAWVLEKEELSQKVASLEEKEKAHQTAQLRLQQEVDRLEAALTDQQADFSGQRAVWAEEKDQLEARVRSQNRLLDEKFESELAS